MSKIKPFINNLLAKIDRLALIETESQWARRLERAAFILLVLMTVSAPHSIAATQSAWLTGMFLYGVRFLFKPRPRAVKTPLDIALWTFFGWTVLTAVLSYTPLISIDKLRNAALFLIFYFVVNLVRTKRAAYFLAFALIFSTMINVVWVPIERLIGRGVEIHQVRPESPLAGAYLIEGDTLLEADGVKLKTPEQLLEVVARNEITKVKFYRPDFYYTVEVKRENLLSGASATEKLGIGSWRKSRNWRSSGFYGMYATYAEVLQLIASLAFGLFIGSLRRDKTAKKRGRFSMFLPARPFSPPLLLLCVGGMALALLLTVTRASQLAFLISAFTIVLIGASRKMFLLLLAVALPLAIGGLIFLQSSRQVGFFDPEDDSIRWRQTVYREGFELWTQNPRHFSVGVGMDAIKIYAKSWRLFDDGKLPMGHFHSTPLQLVVERGLPALLLWLWVLWIYARLLRRGMKLSRAGPVGPDGDARSLDFGILLGCFGGLIGFAASGLVHYNLGDAEVAMVFFLLMGLAVRIVQQSE